MSATRSISDLELPVDEEQRHVMPLREPVEYPSSLALLEEQQRQHDAMRFEEQRKEAQAWLLRQRKQEEKAAMRLRKEEYYAQKCPRKQQREKQREEEYADDAEKADQLVDDADRDARIVAESRRAHREGRAAAAVERCALTMERLEGPVRIRPEPADRNLESETEDNAKLIAHHQHRCHEEITDIRRKFACRRENARVALYAQLDRLNAKFVRAIADLPEHEFEKLHILTAAHAQGLHDATGNYRRKLCNFSSEQEAWKVMIIKKRRAMLAWTCPNDGQAHPFTIEGRRYHRTYWGEMWLTENWLWQGYWVGYYIKSGKPPRDDEVSDEIRAALKG